jgi:hypothetical protein
VAYADVGVMARIPTTLCLVGSGTRGREERTATPSSSLGVTGEQNQVDYQCC